MTALRITLIALPVLLLAACGPLEEDGEAVAEEMAMAQVLPDVEEPAPPEDLQAQAAAPLPSRRR